MLWFMAQYDFLIVGSGLFGAVFAYKAKQHGKRCLVIEQRSHKGGNIYCNPVEGINVHQYGPHIFHTNDKEIWDFVNSFVEFNRFTYMPVANYKGKMYNLPFNMNTFYQMWNISNPEEAKHKIEEQVKKLNFSSPKNLEEQALQMVGPDIYHTLIKGYTEKQWGRKATELPPSIIKRIPVRFTFDNNYFNDKYQGIPIGGYNKLINGLLDGIEVKLNTDYFENSSYFSELADKIIYTGPIDRFYGYRFGALAYRSLNFQQEILETANYQGNAAVNYTDSDVPYTRIIEHKHFEFGNQPVTVITKEYPIEWQKGAEPFYPINDAANNQHYQDYAALAKAEEKVFFGGRLAEYKYYDMHQVIASALKKSGSMIQQKMFT